MAHCELLELEQPVADSERTNAFIFDKLWLKLFTLSVDVHFFQMFLRHILIIHRFK